MVPGPMEFYLLHPKTKALAVSIRTGIDMAYYVRVPQQSSPLEAALKCLAGMFLMAVIQDAVSRAATDFNNWIS